ncbi:DUF6583 family protein [Metabacillus iocasae]|uniref:Uncharacterized protein n=1 Tax=Priestia iocasae TaxID=2291674 RepID=A0ABS2QY59_9BACI|nr:DUF6583 family protein [Metabacillus iocasae]MBM7704133.1 hypothetical protein [Metabacillus iocasae]
MNDQYKSRTEAGATIEAEQTPKRVPVKWIVAAALIFVLIGASVTFGVFFSKSAKDIYLLSEYNAYKQLSTELEKKYGNQMEFQEKTLEKPSSTDMKISGNVDMSMAQGDPNLEMLQRILKETAITIKTEQDPKAKASAGSIMLNAQGTKVGFDMFYSDTQAGVKIPLIYDDYFYLNTKDYGQFMRMFDPYYVGPETLEIDYFEWKDLKLTEAEQKHLKEHYSTFLMEQLKEEYFTKEKGIAYKHEGEEMKLTKVTLAMSPEETKQILTNLVSHMSEDEKLIDILTKRAVSMAKASSVNTQAQIEKDYTNPKVAQKEIEKGLKEMKQDVEKAKYPKGFTSTLLVTKDNVVVDRTLQLAVQPKDRIESKEVVEFAVKTKNVPIDDNKTDKLFKFEVGSKGQSDSFLSFESTNTMTEQKENRIEKRKLNLLLEEKGQTPTNIGLTVDSTFKNSGEVEREFSLQADEDIPSMSGTLTQKQDIDLEKERADHVFDVELNVEDGFESATLFLNIDSKTELKEKVTIPSMNANSAINVLEMTEEDVYAVQEHAAYRIQSLMQELSNKYY